MDDDLLGVPDLAALAKVSPATIYGWRTRGQGPRGIKVGGQLRFRRSEIDRWLEANSDDPGAPVASPVITRREVQA